MVSDVTRLLAAPFTPTFVTLPLAQVIVVIPVCCDIVVDGGASHAVFLLLLSPERGAVEWDNESCSSSSSS